MGHRMGAGIYRHVNLVSASRVHVAEDGVFAYANVSDAVSTNGMTPAEGIFPECVACCKCVCMYVGEQICLTYT